MSRIIYKYPLENYRAQQIDLPKSHQLLCVQVQSGVPTLWAIVDAEAKVDSVTIRRYGTGSGNPGANDLYLGTVQLDGLVWHYFEVTP